MGIRKMIESDIEQVVELINELSSDLNEDFNVKEEDIFLHYYNMNRYNELYTNLVFSIDEKILGFISILFYRSFLHKKGTALINELIVNRKYRNQKIGKQLLDYGIKIAKENEMDEIEVGVMKENNKAIEFYKKKELMKNTYY